jgi:YHS domain-containing protein
MRFATISAVVVVWLTASVFALAQQEQATSQPAEVTKGDPYMLPICVVSGERLGSKGDPVVKDIDGRQVRFCCKNCVGEFEKDPRRYFAEIDEKIISRQTPFYPMDVCVVMPDDPLNADGKFIGVDFVYKNRLIRFCCKMCARKFKEDPADYLAKLNTAVIEKQRDKYPLTQCVVGGGELGSMGEPVEIIVGNRLVRFCCSGCEAPFLAQPAKYVKRIDDAWKTQR